MVIYHGRNSNNQNNQIVFFFNLSVMVVTLPETNRTSSLKISRLSLAVGFREGNSPLLPPPKPQTSYELQGRPLLVSKGVRTLTNGLIIKG